MHWAVVAVSVIGLAIPSGCGMTDSNLFTALLPAVRPFLGTRSPLTAWAAVLCCCGMALALDQSAPGHLPFPQNPGNRLARPWCTDCYTCCDRYRRSAVPDFYATGMGHSIVVWLVHCRRGGLVCLPRQTCRAGALLVWPSAWFGCWAGIPMRWVR